MSLKKKIFAICWGLQLIVTASGGEVKKSNTGTQVGIAVDIELTSDGLNHPVYKSKSDMKIMYEYSLSGKLF